MDDLVIDGVLSSQLAELLLAIIDRRISLSVISPGARAGKTTLLSSLLTHLPSNVSTVSLRGTYERFDFVWEPALPPRETALLVNEISPHLPFYLWGPGVARTLRLGRRGYAIYTTAHAGSAAEFVALLENPPLGVPLVDIASLGVIVSLETDGKPGEPFTVRRRVSACTGLALSLDGQHVERFALADTPHGTTFAVLNRSELASWQARFWPDAEDLLGVKTVPGTSLRPNVAWPSILTRRRE